VAKTGGLRGPPVYHEWQRGWCLLLRVTRWCLELAGGLNESMAEGGCLVVKGGGRPGGGVWTAMWVLATLGSGELGKGGDGFSRTLSEAVNLLLGLWRQRLAWLVALGCGVAGFVTLTKPPQAPSTKPRRYRPSRAKPPNGRHAGQTGTTSGSQAKGGLGPRRSG